MGTYLKYYLYYKTLELTVVVNNIILCHLKNYFLYNSISRKRLIVYFPVKRHMAVQNSKCNVILYERLVISSYSWGKSPKTLNGCLYCR